MRIRVKYFSALRDITQKVQEELEVPEGYTLGDLMTWFFNTYPKALAYKDDAIFLVNGKTATENYLFKDGDEVAIMPPVSGGGGVGEEVLDLNKEVADIISKAAPRGGGGVVIFVGFVKGRVGGAEVQELQYEAYEPYASQKIAEIEQWARGIDGVLEARIYHRVGSLRPGDHTIYVMVAGINRDVAFAVARQALERVKHEVPIFKLERRDDGDYWVVGDGRRVKKQ
ncbi:MAG: MoaD family protein [Thermoproteus sp. AZ2]|uniref:MoaD family protein n=1 Tax=Thermoproteus sp. AZ2 TaxID=1609232 RepID=A0ACC6UYV3_9CREN